MKLKTHGFTLLEIVLVMGIITILLGGGFFSYLRVIERSRINQALADIQAISQAIHQYHADLGEYPLDVCRGQDPGLETASFTGCGGSSLIVQNTTKWRGPYLSEFPDETPWGGEYDYDAWLTSGIINTHRTNDTACVDKSRTMSPGIYITIRPNSGTGVDPSSPSEQAETYFRRMGQDLDWCVGINGSVYYLIKRI